LPWLIAVGDIAAMEAEPVKAEPPKRKRRFQFRLRTLFVAVTLLAAVCGYVAHEAKIVRKRREWLKAHPFPPVVDRLSSAFPGFFGPSIYPGEVERGPSFIRRLLGDVPVTEVGVPASASAEEKKSVHSLFPETYVEESDRGPG
jgi:hypothetical protein